jgi:transposase-like protein
LTRYSAPGSPRRLSRITEKVVGEVTEWQNRPLDRVYPVMFIDAIHVKVGEGQVTNRPSTSLSASAPMVNGTS